MGYECCEGVRGLKFSRRYFLKQGGVAMVGLSANAGVFCSARPRRLRAAGRNNLWFLFQRGAADGLNIVVPFGEQNYYRMRPSIAIPQPKNGSRGSGFVLTNPSRTVMRRWIWTDFLDCIQVWLRSSRFFHKNQLAIVH